MPNLKSHLRSMLFSALGYGFGFAIGNGFSHLILRSGILEPIRDLFAAQRFVLGIALLLLVVGLGGAVGGAIGGLTLSYARSSVSKPGYAWRSALGFGVSYALILYPLALAISLVSFYSPAKASPLGFIAVVGIAGAIFGAVSGLILGLLTVGRDTWRVFLVNTIAFAVGGAALGQGLYFYFFEGAGIWGVFGALFMFGAIGGGALGFLYSWLAHRQPGTKPARITRTINGFKRSKPIYKVAAVLVLIIVVLALRRLWVITPFKAQSASLATVLELPTTGTHWLSPANVTDVFSKPEAQDSQPDIFADEAGNVAMAWTREVNGAADVYYATRSFNESATALTWLEPVNVSNNGAAASTAPQIVTGSQGQAHIVWVEDSEILYSQCAGSDCTQPAVLTKISGPDCAASSRNSGPSIAIDRAGTIMVTWNAGSTALPFALWPALTPLPKTLTGCVPAGQAESIALQQPRLTGGDNGTFNLVFDRSDNGEVYLTRYANGQWDSTPERLGQGHTPEVYIDQTGQTHVAWCDGVLNYQRSGGQVEQIMFPGCTGRPGLGQDGSGLTRLVWYANEVKNVGGTVLPNELLYESVRHEDGWSEPVIISQTGGFVQPAVATGGEGALHLVWSDFPAGSENLLYTTHTDYDCHNASLSSIEQAVFDVDREATYRLPSDIVPFCHNQYEGLVFAPNPLPAFSDDRPTENGAFDKLGELAKTAQYEVLFSTMWYDEAENNDNPGSVLAEAVAELYQNLKENPARYPRGLTVRILLGNPPQFVLFPLIDHQIRHLLDDLRAAGIPEMSNPDIGWKLEVANFDGSWPHSHTKILIVDGKRVIANGFNMQYSHLPEDHPSGLGQGRVDLGVEISGPVAQETLAAFDDLWSGSDMVHCSNFDPAAPWWWFFSCSRQTATAEHVPEVLRYYLPEGDSNAFSLHRTSKFTEGDDAYLQALAAATSSIDTIQVNFTLSAACDLNVLFEVCNYANRLDYMDAIMQAIETHQIKARILVEQNPIDGLENKIAINVFQDELEARGLSEHVEIRFFDGETHIKSAFIDDEFLVIGSQNYHYSAWGVSKGLTEYNLALNAPEAVADYKKMFEYRWQNGISITEP